MIPESQPPESEAAMIARFSRCWCEAEGAVRAYFSGVIFNRADIPDLLQCTAICAFKKFASYDPARPFRAWVLGIACYKALGYIRDHGRTKVVFNSEVSELAGMAVAQEREENNRRLALLNRAMAELPEQSRMILKMHYHQKIPLADVAATLGMNEGALRTALCRLRGKIREMILQYERQENLDDQVSFPGEEVM